MNCGVGECGVLHEKRVRASVRHDPAAPVAFIGLDIEAAAGLFAGVRAGLFGIDSHRALVGVEDDAALALGIGLPAVCAVRSHAVSLFFAVGRFGAGFRDVLSNPLAAAERRAAFGR